MTADSQTVTTYSVATPGFGDALWIITVLAAGPAILGTAQFLQHHKQRRCRVRPHGKVTAGFEPLVHRCRSIKCHACTRLRRWNASSLQHLYHTTKLVVNSFAMVYAAWTLLSFAALSYAAAHKRAGSASAYSSNSAGNYKLSPIAAPVQGSGSPGSESTWKLSIDDTSSGHKQTIVGFGAAVTDATVTSFNTLSSSNLQSLLNELMTSSGADFSLMRHTIGASDLSGDPAYTYDDNGGAADPSMSGFNLGDRGTAMAKMLAKMKSLQSKLKIFGSPWSAPGWMKLNGVIDGTTTNNNLNDGYLSGGTGSSGYASAFADYFVKYIQAYENLGAHIDAITIQNEPLNSQAGYPTMYVFADESAQLIQKYIGPALSHAGLNTDIWAYDHNTGESNLSIHDPSSS